MAFILIMPRQGNTVESCIIDEWKVQEGDSVEADTTVCVVETDKATFEVPAGAQGKVLKLLRMAGDDVPVLEAIAVIGVAGEDWSAALAGAGSGGGAEARPAVAAVSTAAASADGGGRPEAEGAAQPGAAPVRPEAGRIPISPRARNLADREGLAVGLAEG
ncbi:MAG: 2-oxo acid dehydrogenase subunit E2, partial [Treponema sp.]|nr:2-oxo acid dehydrogenase subunit E2 [Treponema sp.]